MSSNSIAIDRLRNKLADAKKELVENVQKNIRDELELVVRRLFAAGQTPDGTDWAPRKKRSGAGLALQSLVSGLAVIVDGNEVIVRLSHPKAKYQQGGWRAKSGSKRTVARLMMPGRKRIGREWLNAIRRGADRAFRAAARAAKKGG